MVEDPHWILTVWPRSSENVCVSSVPLQCLRSTISMHSCGAVTLWQCTPWIRCMTVNLNLPQEASATQLLKGAPLENWSSRCESSIAVLLLKLARNSEAIRAVRVLLGRALFPEWSQLERSGRSGSQRFIAKRASGESKGEALKAQEHPTQ